MPVAAASRGASAAWGPGPLSECRRQAREQPRLAAPARQGVGLGKTAAREAEVPASSELMRGLAGLVFRTEQRAEPVPGAGGLVRGGACLEVAGLPRPGSVALGAPSPSADTCHQQ